MVPKCRHTHKSTNFTIKVIWCDIVCLIIFGSCTRFKQCLFRLAFRTKKYVERGEVTWTGYLLFASLVLTVLYLPTSLLPLNIFFFFFFLLPHFSIAQASPLTKTWPLTLTPFVSSSRPWTMVTGVVADHLFFNPCLTFSIELHAGR